HILFVTGEYPPQTGGVGAYTAELAAALAARGWHVSVLTGANAPQAQRKPDAVTVYPLIRRWGWRIWGQAARLAQEIGASWVHVQYQTAAFGMNPAIHFAPGPWQRRGLLVAWTYHDLLVPYLFPKAGERLRRWVTDRPARVCDLTLVTNEGDRRHLAGQARRLACIPIGSNIRARVFSPEERAALRARRGFGPDDLVVGYFGFLNRSKGGLTLVETLARLTPTLPRVRLLMIGERVGASDPTNDAYLQEVEAAIAAHRLQDRVIWTGRQEDTEVSASLAACDVLLMPYVDGASLRRGTLMAGLAHGCAIVTTTPQAPLPELVEGRDLLYVPPGDPAAAAAAVLRIASDPVLAETLRRHARIASAAFSWETIAEAHERLYLANDLR
ncbi:MAG TPA: glycosyltransferase family 4 protein, partial [Caldilineaceae bacterium]|nr:glycosyltransferase family 4 protein [Caldilineaceae bacterium]